MCDLLMPFLKLLCQSNTRRNWFFLLILLFLVTYFFIWRQGLGYPYDVPEHWQLMGVDSQNTPLPLDSTQSSPLDVYDVTVPYEADFKCVKTRTDPVTTVCIFSQFTDMYISHDLEQTGLWEPQVMHDLLEALRRDPDAGLIDVGANVGFYSLLAARAGHNVVAVEPNRACIQRIHRAALIEGVAPRLTVLRNAVADVRTHATIRASGDNQGDTRVRLGVRECVGACPDTVRTIVLDDITEVTRFSSAILKIDSQGYEHRAFRHASSLFDEVLISYIFMEWTLMRTHHANHTRDNTPRDISHQVDPTTDDDRKTIEEMLRFFFTRNYRPFALSAAGGGPLDVGEWDRWPDDIVWHRLPGPAEKFGLVRKHFRNWPR